MKKILAFCCAILLANGMAVGDNIGTSWPDRRPIGRIIFAQSEKITATNLNGWSNGGPNVMGVSAFQQDILSWVSTAIANVKLMHGQGIIIWDIAGCGATTWGLGSEDYLGDPRLLNPQGSGLTVRTAYSPYVPPASALGRNGIEPSMDAIVDRVFASIRNAGLTCGVGLRAEKVFVNANGQLDGNTTIDGQLLYNTVTNQLADLDAKLTYAYNRWGCRLFYVDSNVASQEVLSIQQIQNNPTWAPAWVYTQLHLRHTDCLILPEEAYSGPFTFDNPPINDPWFQYDRVVARYTELINPWQYPFVGFNETAVVPDTFTVIETSDMGYSDPADTPNVVAALRANQTILMTNAWYDDPGITLIINWQIAAGLR